ncbi:MAG TPA: hypothetical protein PKD54_02745 [Pirellulaceae bacterium]|nr:hypothetical protein [Pirellulaceae bacterium]
MLFSKKRSSPWIVLAAIVPMMFASGCQLIAEQWVEIFNRKSGAYRGTSQDTSLPREQRRALYQQEYIDNLDRQRLLENYRTWPEN